MPEVVYEPTAPPRAITRARSTVLLASRASLVAAGHAAAYEAALDGAARAALDQAIAGSWLPVSIAEAHYRACDRLGLSANTVVELGRGTNERIKGTLYGTFIRLFREAGGGPWNILGHWPRFWERAYDGGGMRVTKLGPKDARVDVLACSLCDVAYYRHALRGLANGFNEIFCARSYGTEIGRSRDGVSYRFQWV